MVGTSHKGTWCVVLIQRRKRDSVCLSMLPPILRRAHFYPPQLASILLRVRGEMDRSHRSDKLSGRKARIIFTVSFLITNHINVLLLYYIEKHETIWFFTLADFRGRRGTHPASYGPKFSQFHAFLENLAKSYVSVPEGSAPPPTGNLGFAPF